jgi:pyridoxine/pyridoxamine 5'-phosphate oxidase
VATACHDPRVEERFAAAEAQLDGGPVPRPSDWGGYRLSP